MFSATAYAKDTILSVQEWTYLAIRALANLFRHPRYIADTLRQADYIGVGSLPIAVLTGFFIGGVLALNSARTLQTYGSITLIGQLVSISMVREIGPVLTGLMVAGRNASGMASELGSMQVTEQIDAMRALGTDPSKKLVTPRLVATVVMLFFLTIISDLCGLTGGATVASFVYHLDSHQYWTSSWQVLEFGDVVIGLVKPILFGFLIATIGCYYGLSTRGGTQGVGRSTTQAMVVSSVLLLVVNYFTSQLLLWLLKM